MKHILLLSFILSITFTTISQTLTIKDFGLPNAGSNPQADLYFDGTFLYGTTSNGGVSNLGTVFKVRPDGEDFQPLRHFTGGTTDGGSPQGGVTMGGGYLYGTTASGGTAGCGVIYRVSTDGTDYDVIYNFPGGTGGKIPMGELFFQSGYLYGVTQLGGTSNKGTVYRVQSDGMGFQILHSFSGAVSGSSPYDGVVYHSGYLFGTTYSGGANNGGVIFRIQTDGSNFLKLHDCAAADGTEPWCQLSFDGTYLYGTCSDGGANGFGTLFKMKPDGTEYSVLISFNETTTGAVPRGDIVLDGSIIYGTLSQGGSVSDGLVYKINVDGSGFVKLKNFTFIDDAGFQPKAGLITDGNFLYGTNHTGGAQSEGTVFRVCLYHPVAEGVATPPWICEGGSVTLTGSGADDIMWADGVIDGVPVSPTATTSYTLTVTDSMGCAGTDLVNVFVYECLGTNENFQEEIKVTPNPSAGIFNVQVSNTVGFVQVKIWDSGMKEVGSYEQLMTDNEGKFYVDLSHLETGIYLLEILSEDIRQTLRVVVSH